MLAIMLKLLGAVAILGSLAPKELINKAEICCFFYRLNQYTLFIRNCKLTRWLGWKVLYTVQRKLDSNLLICEKKSMYDASEFANLIDKTFKYHQALFIHYFQF